MSEKQKTLDPHQMLLDAARFIEADKPLWAKAARDAVAAARCSAESVQKLRRCGMCMTWNSKPCGEQCGWSPDDPVFTEPQIAPHDDLEDLVARFSKALLAKLKLARANGRSGWQLDDWEEHCHAGLLRHLAKGDPRDVAAYCAFMWHHGWATKAAAPVQCQAGSVTTTDEVARLRAAIDYACDLLAERTYGSQARSPGHNARLHLEAALTRPLRADEAHSPQDNAND
jgi:hypothetical protein